MMLRFLQMAALTLLGAALARSARAGAFDVLERALAEHSGAQRAEVLQVLSIQPAQPLDDFESARVLFSNAAGEAAVLVRGYRGRTPQTPVAAQAEYRVRFAGWKPAWVATRRVLPGEPLNSDSMKLQEVNVASGLAHEYRGILLSSAEDLSRLEARQTLLEGGVVTATAVRRIPDLRRGDAVRIEVISGDVHLSAPALALEPGVINQKIKVQTLKTKRELVGLLRSGGTVEVRL